MRLARRIVVIWAIDALALWILAQFVPGLELSGWVWAIWAVAAIGLFNALLRPLLLVVMLPFTILSLGLLSVVLNALIVLLADTLLAGFIVRDLLAAVWTVLGIAAINTIVTGLLSINDDESFYRNVILRIARRAGPVVRTSQAGLVIVEIDGLSTTALKRALDGGYMPNLSRWLEEGNFTFTPWDCGLPSQTSSSQAGILYGRNFGIPAFRWYEKRDQRLMVSNRPWTAAEIHRRVSDGTGLLSKDGSSLTNLVSGDAKHSMMTLSSLMDGSATVRQRSGGYFMFFLNPYSFSRVLVLMVWEVLREIGQRWRGRIRHSREADTRGGSFPLLRAVSNVFLRELNLYLLIENMLSGTPITYSTFLGYDVVAHHVGPLNRDALQTLRYFDEGLGALERAARRAPRPYHFVLLSDHGQSPGPTFLQRYDLTLEQLIERATDRRESVTGPTADDEGWAYLNALLSQAIREENVAGRTARRVFRRRTQEDGYVDLGPGSDELEEPESEVVVCTSGNLGLVYFTGIGNRLTLEDLTVRYPRLVSVLVAHPGIGFVLVRSEVHGSIVLGRRGINYIDRGVVEGVDPLEHFGRRAVDQLKRLDSFPNIGDLLINSVYYPGSGEVAAFEELVGSHGGLGGDQTRAFILYPSNWDGAEDEIDGPEGVHRLLRRWINSHLRATPAELMEPEPVAGPRSSS